MNDIFKILTWPEDTEMLRKPTDLVKQEDITDEFKSNIQKMKDTLTFMKGIGLSANQVGISKRFAIFFLEGLPELMINPVINACNTEKEDSMEGCLSVPSYYDKVSRYKEVTVTYTDIDWNMQTVTLTQLPGYCVQHEVDHLDGILFINHLSELKRNRARKKVKDFKRSLAKFTK